MIVIIFSFMLYFFVFRAFSRYHVGSSRCPHSLSRAPLRSAWVCSGRMAARLSMSYRRLVYYARSRWPCRLIWRDFVRGLEGGQTCFRFSTDFPSYFPSSTILSSFVASEDARFRVLGGCSRFFYSPGGTENLYLHFCLKCS